MEESKKMLRQSFYYSVCGALMIVSIRELYDSHYTNFIVAGVVSFFAYYVFLYITHKKEKKLEIK